MTIEQATYAQQCCPVSALAALTPDELRHLDRYCQRAMADPDAEPSDDERPAVARYEVLLDAGSTRGATPSAGAEGYQ